MSSFPVSLTLKSKMATLVPKRDLAAGDDELESLFKLATEFVRDLRDLKNEEKLKFYGLFKQVSL